MTNTDSYLIIHGLLDGLMEIDKMQRLSSICMLNGNEFNKFNNI